MSHFLKLFGGFSSGGGSPIVDTNALKEFIFDAAALHAVETNFAPLEQIGTNTKVLVRAFDDTTEEFANGKIVLPADIKSGQTVNFDAWVMAKTAAASKNVALTFGHIALADDEDFDPATPYTDEDIDDQAIAATQDHVTKINWTETLANLGWAAGDQVIFRISRFAATTNNLTGDMYLFAFVIRIERE